MLALNRLRQKQAVTVLWVIRHCAVCGKPVVSALRKPPVGHRAIGIELQTPPKNPLRFLPPKTMEQSVALIEPLLDFGRLRRDRERGISESFELLRARSHPRIEGCAHLGMAERFIASLG